MQAKLIEIITSEKTQKFTKLGMTALALLAFFMPGLGITQDEVPTIPIN